MNDTDTAQEFQRRRRKTFRHAMVFALAILTCLILLMLIGMFDLDFPLITIMDVPVYIVPVLIIIITLLWALLLLDVTSNYRCPRCNEIPISAEYSYLGGFELNPDICPKCQARLR